MAKHWLIGALVSAALHGGVAAVIIVSMPQETTNANAEPRPVMVVELVGPRDVAASGAAGATTKADLPDLTFDKPEIGAGASAQPAAASGPSAPKTGDASAGAALDPAALSDYYRRLESHLARFHTYPALGGRRPAGLARVGLIVNRRGQILDAWIETSSGSPELDDSALRTVRRSEPLPSLPGELPASIDLIVPLNFESGMRPAS